MRRRNAWLVVPGIIALLGTAAILWAVEAFPFTDEDPNDDPEERSTDLATDLKGMWRTRRLRSQHDPSHGESPRASTPAAIKAASRVFNTVQLIGLTREEVVSTLGDPKTSSDSIYNFPFYPGPPGGMVYRFDTGSYGWQFNLHPDDKEKVSKVERLWIH
jgi:hypothetical protein